MYVTRTVAVAGLVLLSTACQTINKYQEPNSGQMATVTLKTFAANYTNIGVVSYRGREYLESKGDVIGILNSKMIGYEHTDSLSFKVTAGQEFRFSTKVGGTTLAGPTTLLHSTCQTHSGFVPEAGATYLIEHRVSTSTCKVELFRQEDSGNLKQDLTLKNYKSCLDPRLTNAYSKKFLCQENFSYE